MANNNYARRYRVRHEKRTDGALSGVVNYSLVATSEDVDAPAAVNPPGFTPYANFLALQADTEAGYATKVGEFLTAIKADMAERETLRDQARFLNVAGCPLPETGGGSGPVVQEPNVTIQNFSAYDMTVNFAGDNGTSVSEFAGGSGQTVTRYLNSSASYTVSFDAMDSIKVLINGQSKQTNYYGHPVFNSITPPMTIRIYDSSIREINPE